MATYTNYDVEAKQDKANRLWSTLTFARLKARTAEDPEAKRKADIAVARLEKEYADAVAWLEERGETL